MWTGVLIDLFLVLSVVLVILVVVVGFRRLRLFLNVVLGRVERQLPPEERAREFLRRARERRSRFQERVAAVKANVRMLEKRLSRYTQLRDEWTRRAAKVLKDEEEQDRARYAAARIIHYEQLEESCREILTEQRELLIELESKLAKLEMQVERGEQRAEFIRVSSDVTRVNRALVELKDEIGGPEELEVSDDLSRLQAETEQLRFRSEALAEIKGGSETDHFAVTLEEEAVTEKLAELRENSSACPA